MFLDFLGKQACSLLSCFSRHDYKCLEAAFKMYGQQLLDFMEVIEDRHGQKATIIVSQLLVANWYDVMKGNTTAADAILDRLVHTSVCFELKGASMRQKSNIKSTETHRND